MPARGLAPWNCNVNAGRVQYGAASRGKSPIGNRTASRVLFGRVRPPSVPGRDAPDGQAARSGVRRHEERGLSSAGHVGEPTLSAHRSALKTCLEATQLKVLVTFESWALSNALVGSNDRT